MLEQTKERFEMYFLINKVKTAASPRNILKKLVTLISKIVTVNAHFSVNEAFKTL